MKTAKRVLTAALVLVLLAALLPASAAAETGGDYKLLALTFDDGPSEFTAELLDGLRERNAHCTFFLVGYMAARYPELLQRMADEGHQLANHTYDHSYLNVSNVEWEVSECRKYLEAVTGEDRYYVRPPYGSLDDAAAAKLGAPAILWSVDPYDWKEPGVDVVVGNITYVARDGDIILLHDSHYTSVLAALRTIDQLQAQGYEFVTVEELFRRRGITPQNGVKYRYVRNEGINLPPAEPEYYNEDHLQRHWAYPAIQYVLEKGYFTGMGNGKFAPNKRMTRGMFVTVLGRLAGVEPKKPAAGEIPFADVTAEAYYAPYVLWAYENGIVSGYGDGTFRPEDYVTREQMAKLICAYLSYTGRDVTPPAGYVLPYADGGKIEAYARDSVAYCTSAGLLTGDDRGFRPGSPATRAQGAAILMRLDQLPPLPAPAEPETPQESERPE